MAAEMAHRGQMSAWLQKKKSGASVVRMRQYNKRYFTLDFDSRVFYYSHAETSKKASVVIPFAEIVDVRLPESQTALADNASECSRQSKVSLFRRMGGITKKDDDQEQYGLIVVSKPATAMELACSSATEAAQWFEALRAAIKLGGGTPQPSAETFAESESARSGGMSAAAGKGAGRGSCRGGGYPAAATDSDGVDLSTGHPLGGARPPVATEAVDGLPQPRKNFLDFAKIEEESRPGTPETGDTTAVLESGLSNLQASDFGFGADEDGASSIAPSSAPSSPRGLGGGEDSAALAAADRTPNEVGSMRRGEASPLRRHEAGSHAGADDETTPTALGRSTSGRSVPRSCYQDRHQGQSLQERLASLEFSDAEDEDEDDPLGLKKKEEEEEEDN